MSTSSRACCATNFSRTKMRTFSCGLEEAARACACVCFCVQISKHAVKPMTTPNLTPRRNLDLCFAGKKAKERKALRRGVSKQAGPHTRNGVDGDRPDTANTAYIKARGCCVDRHDSLRHLCLDRVVIRRISFLFRSVLLEKPSGYLSSRASAPYCFTAKTLGPPSCADLVDADALHPCPSNGPARVHHPQRLCRGRVCNRDCGCR